mmetsp:Transcript_110549/g.253066  ORF Transcript_110549/g.253066 Transcript_110549/m.253066 type:complete len:223 (-) Transcript_110549:774-1442(-)
MVTASFPLQPTLRSPHFCHSLVEIFDCTLCDLLGFSFALLIQQRKCGPDHHHKIHQPGSGLASKGEMLSPTFPHAPGWVVPLHETKRSVVHGTAADEAIVTVEIPLTIADTKPIYHQLRHVASCLVQHFQNSRLQICTWFVHLWVLTVNGMLNHQLQFQILITVLGSRPRPAREQLQVAHPYERRGTPAGDRARLSLHNVHGGCSSRKPTSLNPVLPRDNER